MKKRAVFLDRDGTLIEERDYLSAPDGVVLIDGAAEAVRRLSESGFWIVMVTNQSGVARGMFPEEVVHRVNQRVQELLNKENACLDAIYYCPHHPQGTVSQYARVCDCRKPAPGMGYRAAREYEIDLTRSYMIGDKQEDILFGQNCGMENAFLVSTGHGREARLEGGYGMKVENILQAALYILRGYA